MLKTLLTSLAVISFSVPAFAHPEPKPEAPTVETSVKSIEKIQFPTRAELEKARESMPDLNGLMGDMMGMMNNQDFTSKMENTAKAFGEQIEKSGAMDKKGPNDMPDFNALMDTLFSVMGDEDAMGGMLEGLSEMALTMDKSVEKNVPKP